MNVHVDDIKCEFSSDFSKTRGGSRQHFRSSSDSVFPVLFLLYDSTFSKVLFPANTVCRHLDKSPRDNDFILDFDIVSFFRSILIMNIINFKFGR